MDDRAEATREFCRAVPLAGGATTIPRWTLDPAPGVVVHVATLHDHLVAAVRRLADGLQLPLHSVALAAHAKVLAAPSGEHDVVTGYVAGPGGRPMPCRLVPADVHGSVGLPLAGQPSTDREERDQQKCAHHAFRGGRRGRRGAAHARRAATCGRAGAGAGSGGEPDRPVRRLLRRGRHAPVGREPRDRPRPSGSFQEFADHPVLGDRAELLHREHAPEPLTFSPGS